MLRNAVLHGRKIAHRQSAATCIVRKMALLRIHVTHEAGHYPTDTVDVYFPPVVPVPAKMVLYSPVLSTLMALRMYGSLANDAFARPVWK